MSKPGETEYSKGSFPRTWNTDSFRLNFDEIDWSTKKPKPECDCNCVMHGYAFPECVEHGITIIF